MRLSWQELQKALNAQFVGSELIARIGKKNISLGRKSRGEFVFSREGDHLSRSMFDPKLKTPPDVPASLGPRRRSRRPVAHVFSETESED